MYDGRISNQCYCPFGHYMRMHTAFLQKVTTYEHPEYNCKSKSLTPRNILNHLRDKGDDGCTYHRCFHQFLIKEYGAKNLCQKYDHPILYNENSKW